MNTSLLKSALMAVAGLALCAPVALHAQTDTTNPIATSPVKNPAPDTTSTTKTKVTKTEYKGTVKAIDPSSVTVTCKKGDMTFAIDGTTKVQVNKKAAAVTDIAVGEKVTGSYYTDATGKLVASKINGHPGKTVSSAKPASTNP